MLVDLNSHLQERVCSTKVHLFQVSLGENVEHFEHFRHLLQSNLVNLNSPLPRSLELPHRFGDCVDESLPSLLESLGRIGQLLHYYVLNDFFLLN